MRQTPIHSLLVCGILICSTAPAGAQAPSQLAGEACLAGIEASALTRVPVYLEASADPANRHVLPVADAIAGRAARVIRMSLAGADTLASADEPLHWRQLGGTLQVALHRDGRLTWSAPVRAVTPTRGMIPDSAFNAARVLLEQALTAVHGASGPLEWPRDATGDSLPFRLAYLYPDVAEDGTIGQPEARFAFPVFALPVPRGRPLVVRRMPKVHYPATSREGRAEGTVVLRFTVGRNGRVLPGTITDEWRSAQPRPTGNLERYYRDFVSQSIRALEATEFVPAMLGGCVVSQRAEMPFVYEFRR